jgi:von Willebrand factor type A domain
MNRPLLDSGSARLVVVPAGGPIGGDLVGVPASAGAGHALLSVDAGGSQRLAVRLSPLPQVPPGVLVIGANTAENLGILDLAADVRWILHPTEPVDIARVQLELPTEQSAEQAATALGRAGLPGRLLWWPSQRQDCWLDVDGVPHRVRRLDAAGRSDVVGRITERTVVEVFAAGVRNGVDIVILADCSGSMSVWDIDVQEAVHGRGRPQQLSRMDTLRSALGDLLDVRLRTDGRVSRIALVAFTRTTSVMFPRTGDMVELDGSAPPDLVRDFRTAITLLQPRSEGTDIGNALHEAANLLYLSGRPDNEKLIVLVSDGAHWTPKGDAGTGEVVMALQEPVSLMAHLHQNTGIRLHAIGISTPGQYQRWVRAERRNASIYEEPNHTLLEQLVAVGGGNPAAIGGLQVLAQYFSGLGEGTTRTVRLEREQRRGPGPLPAETARILAGLNRGATVDHTMRRAELGSALGELAGRCNGEMKRISGDGTLFDHAAIFRATSRMSSRPSGGDEWSPDADFSRLAMVLRNFRPQPLPDGMDPRLPAPHRRLTTYLEDLSSYGGWRQGDPPHDYATVGALVGDPSVGTAEQAVLACMGRLRALLTDLLAELGQQAPLRATVPDAGAGHRPEPSRAGHGHGHGDGDGDGDGATVTGPSGRPAEPGRVGRDADTDTGSRPLFRYVE